MMRKPFLALVVSAALVVAVFAAAGKSAKLTKPVTVGDFAVKVAAALGSDTSSPKAAAEALRAQGVTIGDELQAPATEGMAARVLADLGMKTLTPSNPNSVITTGVADQLATTIFLGAVISPLDDNNHHDHDDMEKAEACLHSPTQAACVDCCKVVTQCGTSPKKKPCMFCTQICKHNEPPPPSPGEPHK